MLNRVVVAAAVVVAASGAAQPQDLEKVEIKVSKAAGNVYMLEGAGGNIGVSVGEDGIVSTPMALPRRCTAS